MNNVNMEKEYINVAELLKDCPKGMELYSPMFGTVIFEGVRDTGRSTLIDVTTSSNTSVQFYFDGKFNTYYTDSEVTLFPSKGKTWEEFVPPIEFKVGDVLYVDCTDKTDTKQYKYIFILNRICNGDVYSFCHYSISDDYFSHTEVYLADAQYPIRFATEEEKAKLFQAIKDNGYKWNPETKILEKLATPKFKVGDVIQDRGSYKVRIIDVCVDNNAYEYESVKDNCPGSIRFDRQDEWELVSNKFNVTTLVPFESRVLVRDTEKDRWRPAIWGFYSGYTNAYYVLAGLCWDQCIPYEGNEHLMGKKDDCDEYYKIWE